MNDLAVIGGTGLGQVDGVEVLDRVPAETPFGQPSAELLRLRWGGRELWFLARHGRPHSVPPHRINYRANLWALAQHGVRDVIAIAAVGGIQSEMGEGRLVVPDQIIDYTYGRAQTFFEDDLEAVTHIDFTRPYCEALRQRLLRAARELELGAAERATYAATQGPRLETAAEVDRLERDGCHIVGMTGMPEAALARELDLCYATLAVVANRAAGRASGELSMEGIERTLATGMRSVQRVLERALTTG